MQNLVILQSLSYSSILYKIEPFCRENVFKKSYYMSTYSHEAQPESLKSINYFYCSLAIDSMSPPYYSGYLESHGSLVGWILLASDWVGAKIYEGRNIVRPAYLSFLWFFITGGVIKTVKTGYLLHFKSKYILNSL